MNIKPFLLSAVVAVGLTTAAAAQSPPTILGDPPPLPGGVREPAPTPRNDPRRGTLQPLEAPFPRQGPTLGQGQSHNHGAHGHDHSGHDHSGHDHSGHSHAPAPVPSYSDRAPALPPTAPGALPRYGYEEPEFDGPYSHDHDHCPFGWDEGQGSVCPLGRDRLNRDVIRGAGRSGHVHRFTHTPHYHHSPVHVH